MAVEDFDIAIVGSGFGGTLLATILVQQGYRVVVLDRDRHPRFAIGESSTPIADMVLESLALRYDLDELLPLTRYGSAKDTYPDLGIGCKRGFSYFHHHASAPFSSDDNHANQLLVAASSSDELSDTQWYRQDIDQFFCDMARRRGVVVYEGVQLEPCSRTTRWRITGHAASSDSIQIDSDILVDATGSASVVAKWLGIARGNEGLMTASRAIFGHFEGVRPWQEVLEDLDIDVKSHPFACDHAALHHVLPEGWMWQLRFDNGITSLGYVWDDNCDGETEKRGRNGFPAADSSVIQREQWWQDTTGRFPSIEQQLRSATPVTPGLRLRATGRLQFIVEQAAGEGWASLPAAAGFIDPLHSSGIAHTLCGIERLAGCFEQKWLGREMQQGLLNHGVSTLNELQSVDELISICYATRSQFRAWVAACMLYFAAATSYEHRRFDRPSSASLPQFLCANDTEWRAAFVSVRRILLSWIKNHSQGQDVERLEDEVRQLITPMNRVGLMDASRKNMYARTAAPSKS